MGQNEADGSRCSHRVAQRHRCILPGGHDSGGCADQIPGTPWDRLAENENSHRLGRPGPVVGQEAVELRAGVPHPVQGLQQSALVPVAGTVGMVAALQPLGRSLLGYGDDVEAWSVHRRALALATSIGHPAAVCEALEDLAAVLEHRGEHRRALHLLTAARRGAADVPARPGSQAQLEQRIARLRHVTGAEDGAPAALAEETVAALLP